MIFYDNAYSVHDFSKSPKLLNIFKQCEKFKTVDNISLFASTSKITFAGSGIAFIGGSEKTLNNFLSYLGKIIVGADKIGSEYVFVRGSGSDGWENILIVANQDNTDVFIDGGATPIASLASAGDYHLIEGSSFSNSGSNKTLYVRTSKNVYAWQGIGGIGSEANQGMFFVPPLSCQSQGEVNNIPLIENIGTAYFPGYVTVVTCLLYTSPSPRD